MITSLLPHRKCDNTPASNRHLVKPRDPEKESRQRHRRRLRQEAASTLAADYGTEGRVSGGPVYDASLPRRARRRIARALAARYFREDRLRARTQVRP